MNKQLWSLLILAHFATQLISHTDEHQNLMELLSKHNLCNPHIPLQLHLGCGVSHLNGYINIDFPLSEHTIQKTSGADVFADITKLVFEPLFVDHIRSHHLFEHFNRQHALALLCTWHYALKIDGVLTIETPDFQRCIQLLLDNNFSYQQKQIIMRHIFGSHEAYWAMHYDGWYEEKFRNVLSCLGFEIINVQKSSYLVLHNITVNARKKKHLNKEELCSHASAILRNSMVNTSESEEIMWNVWLSEFRKHLFACIL